jgi:hypothetical protein
MTVYRHTQFGWVVFGSMLAAALIALGAAWWTGEARLVVPLLAVLLGVVSALFGSLTIRVSDGWLECRFGVGLIRRRIKLTDIRGVQVVRNRWWYGWGIRLTPHGWLWNVSGLDAVELTLANGKKFRVGTDEPEHLRETLYSIEA